MICKLAAKCFRGGIVEKDIVTLFGYAAFTTAPLSTVSINAPGQPSQPGFMRPLRRMSAFLELHQSQPQTGTVTVCLELPLSFVREPVTDDDDR